MSDPIRWCFTHDHRYDGDASCAAFTGECDTDCEVESLLTRAEWEASTEVVVSGSVTTIIDYGYILDWAIGVGGLNYRPDMQEIKEVMATALNIEGEQT